ncbi:MAG: hypothetical protein ACE5I7_05115 [Candidatus Binatia bacterium]
MTITAHDDYMHENTGESNFNESMYFNFYDRGRKLGGFARIGNRPNEGYAEVTLTVYLPDGSALFNYMRPRIADNSAFDAGGMRFTVLEPFKRLRVTYDGNAVFLAHPLEMEDPKRAFTTNPHKPVQLELEYQGLSPMYGGEVQMDNPQLVFARGHTEQHLKASGRIVVDGTETPLHALGLRDHSWGPRSWQSPKFYRWLTCEFDETFGFMASQIATQGGAELLSGFVFRNGENLFVHACEIDTDWAGQGHYHNRIHARLHTVAGDFAVSGTVLAMLPLRNRRGGKTTRISEGMTEWRHGGHVGYGLSEYLDQTP